MALIRIDHKPETIKFCTPLYLIVPEPGLLAKLPLQERKVLYLLHGLSDDGSAWSRYSAIETVARDYGLVVVMPSVGRSFYADLPNGQAYFRYVAEELPAYLNALFGLRPSREDTLVAGLSMGGYGALKLALNYPERFSAAASLSGLTATRMISDFAGDPRTAEFVHIFGDLRKLPGSQHDPQTWLEKAKASGTALPQLYCACGRQDDLLAANREFRASCNQLGVALDYIEEDGQHDWYFWDRHIKRFLERILGPVEA